jgi:glucose/mannose-6-phosphate isomerase
MLDHNQLEKYDSSNMYKIYDKWPQIAKDCYESNHDTIDFGPVNHIVFSGMGGSGTVGDVLAAILSKTKIHVDVVKGYLLPKTLTQNSLVVAVSVSGNTIETLNVLDSSKHLTNKIIAFSSGGKMEDFCLANNLEFRKIPKFHSPRASFPAFLYSIFKVLSPILPIKNEMVYESLDKIEKLSKKINSSNLSETNTAIRIASEITKLPVIYYPWGLQSVAIRFKNALAENAKTHSIIEDVIEACHNGIVSWERPSNVQPILIQGDEDYIKTKERWKILKLFFDENNISYQEIFSTKGNIISKLIHLIYFLDYVSIYYAVLSKIDPTPIKPIDFIKNQVEKLNAH